VPMSKQEADTFLEDLPRIGRGDSFRFACHPEVACFNRCCADLDLVLHPYDVLRLRRALRLAARDFMHRYAEIGIVSGTGFPQVSLRMKANRRMSCPFVSPEGCTVYADRPGACRTYPLGRGASLDADGKLEIRYVLVREAHCRGFEEERAWTVEEWLADQGLSDYLRFNDMHLEFSARLLGEKRTLSREQSGMVLMALYHLDEFGERIESGRWLERSHLPDERKRAILNDEQARLEFAFEWLESEL